MDSLADAAWRVTGLDGERRRFRLPVVGASVTASDSGGLRVVRPDPASAGKAEAFENRFQGCWLLGRADSEADATSCSGALSLAIATATLVALFCFFGAIAHGCRIKKCVGEGGNARRR